ncbi:alpha/beta fold hydrolase [Amycolatopsis jiangsuensis]|uniref:Pimeloyl-ACP methyl ester carboxylesterase n=1 Tax=Amycolatopsis jiangsuensis TaxID=1181879 RepID=A0A840IY61_9PSEU|nr:alpha/beta hydrolase [Amycolatopsis jiangsuensis]MBB4686227.1 pimeloyl-ACP methyl ester carboxylesterase [Amycolatopsis jiangsuensis]
MNVLVEGPGDAPVLLLVHGFGGSLRSFDPVARLLSDRFRIVRADLRGHGRTGGHSGLDARSQARTLADSIGDLSGVTAVGHSFGADVVLELAAQTDAVSRTVLIGQAPDYRHATFPPGHGLLAAPGVSPVLRSLAGAPVTTWALRRTAWHRLRTDFAATSPAMARVVLTERRKLLAERPLDEQLRDLGLPTLVILGSRDRLYDSAATATRYAAAGARVHVLPGAGHSPFASHPARVAGLLAEWAAVRTE